MIQRQITDILKGHLNKFPVLTLTGPRQSGKTTLLKNEFPDYKYFNLERIDHREMILNDPIGFLNSQGPKVIFDEAQRIPELFSYIQIVSDERGTPGQYILSGSQSFLMNNHIYQTLAGRTFISHLLPFSLHELNLTGHEITKYIFDGFYPRLHDADIKPTDFYPSYIQTYIERDIRSLKNIENLNTFARFLGLCAGRIGQVLNLSSLANDTGITVNTAKSWLSLLESSFILYQLNPYYKNFSKRLIKSPKIYFYDTGLACSLLKIQDYQMAKTHYLYGAFYENLILNELLKTHYNKGKIPSIYYWRESNGTEIDCIVELSNNKVLAIEIKAGETFNKDYLKNFKHFPANEENIRKFLIYSGDSSSVISNINIIGKADIQNFINGLF